MAKLNHDEVEFHKLMQGLAEQCGFALTEFTLWIYDDALGSYGYANVNEALRSIFKSRRGGDRFPAIGDILAEMGIEVAPKSLAVDAANRIFWAFAKWKNDFTNREDFEALFREKIGDLPWDTVQRMGGYRSIYEEWDRATDRGVLRAQVRDAAAAILDISKHEERKQIAISGQEPRRLNGDTKK